MKALITATFVCEVEDAEQVENSLNRWYWGHEVGMNFRSVRVEELHFTRPLRKEIEWSIRMD